MSRLPLLALAVLLATAGAPTADAQLGRLLDRAKEAVSGTAERAAESATPDAPRRDGPPPVADYVGLLDTVLAGDWDDNDQYVLFAPEDGPDPIGAYVLREPSGGTVGSVPVKIDHHRRGTVASAVRQSRRGSGRSEIPNANGTLVLDLVFESMTVGSVPYVQTAEQVGNAFDSRTVTRMRGPWQTHGYFADNGDATDEDLRFVIWTTSGEPAPAEVSVRRDGVEVFFGDRRTRVPETRRSSFQLMESAARDADFKNEWRVSRSEMTPGPLEVVVLDEDGDPVRRFTIQAGDGTFVPHPRSVPGYEPHALSLAPRHAASRRQDLTHVYWVTSE